LRLLALAFTIGPVDAEVTQLDQARLPGQLHGLHKQRREFLQMQPTEFTNRAMSGKVVSPEHTEGDVLFQASGNFAGGKHAAGVGVNQHLDHHRRIIWLPAAPVALIALVKGGQVQRIRGVADEIGQMAFRQPVLRRYRQKQGLVRMVRSVARRHTPFYRTAFLRPKLLGQAKPVE